PHPVGLGGHRLDTASSEHAVRQLLEDPRAGARLRLRVFALEEQPLPACALAPAGGAHEVEPATQLVPIELERQAAAAIRLARITLRRPSATVPDDHTAAAVLTLRDDALEVPVFDGMILGLHSEAFHVRIAA